MEVANEAGRDTPALKGLKFAVLFSAFEVSLLRRGPGWKFGWGIIPRKEVLSE
jgi:hypothetical protein